MARRLTLPTLALGLGVREVPPRGGIDRFFGDGSDGALSTSGNLTLPASLDGPLVIRQYTSLTINSGHIVTVANRCAGLVLYVQGDCTIHGTLHMDGRGGRSDQVPFAAWRKSDDFALLRLLPANRFVVGGSGGAGGRGGHYDNPPNHYGRDGGAGGGGRIYGGGYGGGGGGTGDNWSHKKGGLGGAALPGALGLNPTPGPKPLQDGVDGDASCGGSGTSHQTVDGPRGGGGPAGGGGGSTNQGAAGSAGTSGQYPGGLLILIVGGNLTVGATGIIRAAGGTGGTGGAGAGTNASGGGGGGGGGGGAVLLMCRGAYSNSGSVSAPAGAGGSGGARTGTGYAGVAGSSGSAGTVEVVQV